MSSIHPGAGAKIYIGPTTDATDESAYAALSYTEIGRVQTLGEFGDAASAITWTGLSSGRVEKAKGAYDAGDLTVTCAHDPLDAGQLAALTAAGAKFAYAFKVTLEDSADANDTDSAFYFHAFVMSERLNVGGANDVITRTFSLGITTEIIAALSQAVS